MVAVEYSRPYYLSISWSLACGINNNAISPRCVGSISFIHQSQEATKYKIYESSLTKRDSNLVNIFLFGVFNFFPACNRFSAPVVHENALTYAIEKGSASEIWPSQCLHDSCLIHGCRDSINKNTE